MIRCEICGELYSESHNCAANVGELRQQLVELRQILWDIRKELGFDNDGDATPIHVVGDLGRMVLDNAIEFRKDSDCETKQLAKELAEAKAVISDYQNQISELGLRTASAESANARLQAEVDKWKLTCECHCVVLNDKDNEIAKLQAEAAAMLNVLKVPCHACNYDGLETHVRMGLGCPFCHDTGFIIPRSGQAIQRRLEAGKIRAWFANAYPAEKGE